MIIVAQIQMVLLFVRMFATVEMIRLLKAKLQMNAVAIVCHCFIELYAL